LRALVLFLLLSSPSFADVELRSGIGVGLASTWKGEDSVKASTTPIMLAMNVEKKVGNGWLTYGGVFHHQIISFKQQGAAFAGTNILMGPIFGYDLKREGLNIVRMEVGYYPYNVLTLASETTAAVNDRRYDHSTLYTYSGSGAYEFKFAMMRENRDFSSRERLRYGLFASELIQPISKSEVHIATSNSDIAPRKKLKSKVKYQLSSFSAGASVSFAF